MNKETFKVQLNQGNFVEYNEFDGNYYGTNKQKIEIIQQKGKVCLLDMDLDGVLQIFENKLECSYLVLIPPSIEELRKRMIHSRKLEEVERRLNAAKGELEKMQQFTFLESKIISDDIDTTYNEVQKWLQSNYPILKMNTTN